MTEAVGIAEIAVENTGVKTEDRESAVTVTVTDAEMIDLCLRGVRSIYKAAIREKEAGILGGPKLADLIKMIANEKGALETLRGYVNGVDIRREFGVNK